MNENEITYVLIEGGLEWGYFTAAELADMGVALDAQNVKVATR